MSKWVCLKLRKPPHFQKGNCCFWQETKLWILDPNNQWDLALASLVPRAVMYMRLTVSSKTSSNEALVSSCWAAERVNRFASRELPVDSRWEVGSIFKIGIKIQQEGFLIIMNHFFQGVFFWGSLFEMFPNLQHSLLARSPPDRSRC